MYLTRLPPMPPAAPSNGACSCATLRAMACNRHSSVPVRWDGIPEWAQTPTEPPPEFEDRRLPNGQLSSEVMLEASLKLPHFYDALVPVFSPAEIVYLQAEWIASECFHAAWRLIDGFPADDAPDVYNAAFGIAIGANFPYAVWAEAVPDSPDPVADAFKLYERWKEQTKASALDGTDRSPRGKLLQAICVTTFTEGWNIDVEASHKGMANVYVDNIGGNEADPCKREEVPLEAALAVPTFLRNLGLRGVWIAKGGAVVADRDIAKAAFDFVVPRGNSRKAGLVSLEPVLVSEPTIRATDVVSLAVLRELRDLAADREYPIWGDAIDLAMGLSLANRRQVADRMAAVIAKMHSQPRPVQAAITYLFFRGRHRQETVADAFRVQRSSMRNAAPIAQAVIDAALPA